MKEYSHVAIGGTFDHLHIGHKTIIDTAFNLGDKVTIGLVVDSWLENKILTQSIQSYEVRKKSLIHYLESQQCTSRATIIPLNNIYGTTHTDENIDALVVTTETMANAKRINSVRKNSSLKPLAIITLAMKKDGTGKIIRSERIRLGEIDNEGKVFLNIFKKKRQLFLPDELRNRLKKPLGRILYSLKKSDVEKYNKIMLFSVGDIITSELLKMNITPSVQIIDNKSLRKPVTLDNIKIIPSALRVKNPAGSLTFQTAQAIRNARDRFLKNGASQQIVVDGEEDLTALLVILFGPIGSIVMYGQVGLGAVAVEVTKQKKQQIIKIIERFQ